MLFIQKHDIVCETQQLMPSHGQILCTVYRLKCSSLSFVRIHCIYFI